MARLKYMTNNLESPILILHQSRPYLQWNVFYLQWKVFNFEKSTHKSTKTQLIEQRIERKAIIITLIEMSGRKRLIRFKINKEKLRIN